jgi:hypothetical protein
VNEHATVEDGISFDDWYAACDAACVRIAGIGIDDLADGPSRDCYNDGFTPIEYAEERLLDEGFPFDE